MKKTSTQLLSRKREREEDLGPVLSPRGAKPRFNASAAGDVELLGLS